MDQLTFWQLILIPVFVDIARFFFRDYMLIVLKNMFFEDFFFCICRYHKMAGEGIEITCHGSVTVKDWNLGAAKQPSKKTGKIAMPLRSDQLIS